jgi:hypothetical protein
VTGVPCPNADSDALNMSDESQERMSVSHGTMRRVANMQDDDLVTFDRVENRIFEPMDVPARASFAR